MIIKIINCQKGSGKPRKFSRSRMTKRTTPFRHEKFSDPEKFHQILKQSKYFYDFLDDKSSVISGTRFLRKSRKSGNGLS